MMFNSNTGYVENRPILRGCESWLPQSYQLDNKELRKIGGQPA